MQLEDYLEFNTEPVEHIRLKGTRIDIDFIIEKHKRFMTPEEIALSFSYPLNVGQVYYAITYYLTHKEEMEAYFGRRKAIAEKHYQRHLAQPESEAIKRIRAIKAELEAAKNAS